MRPGNDVWAGTTHEPEWMQAHRALTRLARQRARAEREEGTWLLAAQRSQAHRHTGFASFEEYVERLFGYGPRLLADKLRVAAALEDLTVIGEALRRGDITWSAARELTRVATPDTQEPWLEAARGKIARELEPLVSGARPGDLPGAPKESEPRRRVLRFEVSAETFATFREALSQLRAECGARLDDDAALLGLARHVLGGPGDDGRSSYQIGLSVCPACGAGAQHGGGELVPVGPEIVALAECDAQHLGDVGAGWGRAGEVPGEPRRDASFAPSREGRTEFLDGSADASLRNATSGGARDAVSTGVDHASAWDGLSPAEVVEPGADPAPGETVTHVGGDSHRDRRREPLEPLEPLEPDATRRSPGETVTHVGGDSHRDRRREPLEPGATRRSPGETVTHVGGDSAPAGAAWRLESPDADQSRGVAITHVDIDSSGDGLRALSERVDLDAMSRSPDETIPHVGFDSSPEPRPEAVAHPEPVVHPEPDPAKLWPPFNAERPAPAPPRHRSKPARTRQSIPPRIRRLVLHRDHHRCRVPGCRNHAFVDVHHLVPRAEGGANTPENLITLCGAHHRAAHRGELLIRGTQATGALAFRHADGSPYGAATDPVALDVYAKVFGALRTLQFSEREARAALDACRREAAAGVALTKEALLRRALELLAEPRALRRSA